MAASPSTPLRLAQFAMAGVFLCLATWFYAVQHHTSAPDSPPFAHFLWYSRFFLLTCLTPALTGVCLSYGCASVLNKGFIQGRWSEDELSRARAWIEQPILRWSQVALLLAYLVLYTLSTFHHHSTGGLAIFFVFYCTLPYIRIRALLRNPRSFAPPIDWSAVEPLHSTHWGR